MEMIGLRARFDGEQIVLDDPYRLKPYVPWLILVMPHEENSAWFTLTAQGLAAAYGENEPDYAGHPVKEVNPAAHNRTSS